MDAFKPALRILAIGVALGCSVGARPALAQTSDDGAPKGSGYFVVVARFDSVATPDRGLNEVLGQLAIMAGDYMRSGLSKISRVRLLDREHEAEALREIARSWRLEYDRTQRLAYDKRLPARYICSGRVSLSTSRCRDVDHAWMQKVSIALSVQIRETATREILSDQSITINNHGYDRDMGPDHLRSIHELAVRAIAQAAQDASRELANTLPLEGHVVAVENHQALIDLGAKLGVQKGLDFDVMHSPGTVTTSDGVIVERPEELLGVGKVTTVGPESAWLGGASKAVQVGDRVVMKTKGKGKFRAVTDFLGGPPSCFE